MQPITTEYVDHIGKRVGKGSETDSPTIHGNNTFLNVFLIIFCYWLWTNNIALNQESEFLYTLSNITKLDYGDSVMSSVLDVW